MIFIIRPRLSPGNKVANTRPVAKINFRMAGGILAWAQAARPAHPLAGCKGRANAGPGQKSPVARRWSRRRAGALLRARSETAAGILPRARLARALLGSTILEITFGNRSISSSIVFCGPTKRPYVTKPPVCHARISSLILCRVQLLRACFDIKLTSFGRIISLSGHASKHQSRPQSEHPHYISVRIQCRVNQHLHIRLDHLAPFIIDWINRKV